MNICRNRPIGGFIHRCPIAVVVTDRDRIRIGEIHNLREECISGINAEGSEFLNLAQIDNHINRGSCKGLILRNTPAQVPVVGTTGNITVNQTISTPTGILCRCSNFLAQCNIGRRCNDVFIAIVNLQLVYLDDTLVGVLIHINTIDSKADILSICHLRQFHINICTNIGRDRTICSLMHGVPCRIVGADFNLIRSREILHF